jgi:hypothetical protein
MRLNFLEKSRRIQTDANSAHILIYADQYHDASMPSEELRAFGLLMTKA